MCCLRRRREYLGLSAITTGNPLAGVLFLFLSGKEGVMDPTRQNLFCSERVDLLCELLQLPLKCLYDLVFTLTIQRQRSTINAGF